MVLLCHCVDKLLCVSKNLTGRNKRRVRTEVFPDPAIPTTLSQKPYQVLLGIDFLKAYRIKISLSFKSAFEMGLDRKPLKNNLKRVGEGIF